MTRNSFRQIFGIKYLVLFKRKSFSPSMASRHSVPTKGSGGEASSLAVCFAAVNGLWKHVLVNKTQNKTNKKGTDPVGSMVGEVTSQPGYSEL